MFIIPQVRVRGYNKQMRQTDPPYELKLEGCNKFNSSYYSVWIFKIASVHYRTLYIILKTRNINLSLGIILTLIALLTSFKKISPIFTDY
jgi:hypothetical protein